MSRLLKWGLRFWGIELGSSEEILSPQERSVQSVAERFLKLFKDHGVEPTQIQRLIPEITLDKVRSPQALLPALNSAVLDQAAALFGIQRAWLDGTTDRIYPALLCYQDSRAFFDEFASLRAPYAFFPLRAYCLRPKLNGRSDRPQPLVLAFVEKIADWDDDYLLRYRLFTEEWDWGYWKCRVQLKALVRAAYDHLDIAGRLEQKRQFIARQLLVVHNHRRQGHHTSA
jgi:hypothetical protein